MDTKIIQERFSDDPTWGWQVYTLGRVYDIKSINRLIPDWPETDGVHRTFAHAINEHVKNNGVVNIGFKVNGVTHWWAYNEDKVRRNLSTCIRHKIDLNSGTRREYAVIKDGTKEKLILIGERQENGTIEYGHQDKSLRPSFA